MAARSLTLAAVAAVAALGLVAAGAPLRGTILPIDLGPSVIFLDEFEDGGLTVDGAPPGLWDGVTAVPGTDAGLFAAAARSGGRGLRITDVTDVPGVGTTVSPYVALGDAGTGDRYARAWVRVAETADAGIITILQLLHGSRAVVDVNLAFPPGGIMLAGDNADGGYPVLPTGDLIGSDWRLVEVGVIDAGTASVTRVLWLDAALAGQQRVNQSGFTVDELDIGEPWADDGAFQGAIDFDGVAVTTEPPPSHVVVDAGDLALVAGQCTPLSARLMSSSGVEAGALRPDTLSLTASTIDGGSAATFTDPECTTPGSTLDLDAGTMEVAFGIQGLSPGELRISAGSSDLIGFPITKTVLGEVDGGADAGAEDAGDGGEDGGHPLPPRDLGVCGCSAAGGPWSALALGLALALRRRRRAQAVFCTGGAAAAPEARYVR